jgi:DNA-directed RNA polymerase specialized sigma24 family protein
VSPEDFARILALLSPDTEEAGRRYTNLHKKLTGFFGMKGVSDPLTAADETFDRAVLKIGAGTIVPDVDKYCFGIARNVFKERLRSTRRENSAFHEFIEDLSISSAQEVERIYRILKPCFEMLAAEEQQLLMAYCHEIQGRARAEYRRQLAETMKMTVLALRVRVTRLRNILTDCVQKQSNEGFESALDAQQT